jgi:SAM-dependent methyltransferase
VLWGPNNWDAWRLHAPPEDDWASFPEQALRSAVERIPGRRGLTVADLGCGDGRLVPFLADRYARVVAIDYAPASLAEARKRHARENVTYRRRDLRELTPFRGAFDVAIAVHSIVGPRRADVDRILRQVWRTLHEGGLLLALFPAAARVGEPVPLVLDGAHDGPEPLSFLETELQYRLRRAGFLGVRIRRFEAGDTLPGTLLARAARRAAN